MRENKGKLVLTHIILVIFTLVCVVPLAWIVYTSFKPRNITFAMPPVWFFRPTLENYITLFQKYQLSKYFINSLYVVSLATVLSTIIGSLAAFAFARFRMKRKKGITFWILSTRFFPPVVVLLPIFLIVQKLGLYDTRFILTFMYTGFNIPLAVWLMRSFFYDIPVEIEESALIDGCSRLRSFFRITLPLSKPGIVATAVLSAIFSWNEFIAALILTSENAKTLPIMTTGFLSAKGVMWGEMTAGCTIIVIPVIIFAFIVQKDLVRGLTFGAIK